MSSPCESISIFSHPYPDGSRFSHSLLLAAAQSYSGLSTEQLGPVETNTWGKPFFAQHPDLHFSITHSGNWWLCAFSNKPVGLDLQIHQTHYPPEKLSHRFFHPLEDAFLAKENYQRFFDLWAAKESWVKHQGHGFSVGTKSFSVVSSDGIFPSVDGVQLRFFPFAEGYSLCLCSRALNDVHFHSFSLS